MSGNQFIPDVDEQAAEILRLLREHDNFEIAESVTPSDITAAIDPDKPVSVNLKTVAEGFEGTL